MSDVNQIKAVKAPAEFRLDELETILRARYGRKHHKTSEWLNTCRLLSRGLEIRFLLVMVAK